MNVIETKLLTKRFGNVTAIDRVSIHVGEGEIYGLLGLNGAGKTTLIRMLLGMIKPNEGETILFGKIPGKSSSLWNEVGYLVESPHAYPELSVRENLKVIYKLRGLTDPGLIGTAIEVMKLSRYEHVKEKHLSLGNKQRLGLAKALIHKPKLLILDEPINGLDPAGIVEIRSFLKELVKEYKTTIFLSSHILTEIAKLATRIGIVHNGLLIKEINADELEQQIQKKLMLDTSDNQHAVALLAKRGIKSGINGLQQIECLDAAVIDHPEDLVAYLVKEQLPPRSIHVLEEDLEAFFLRMITEKSEPE